MEPSRFDWWSQYGPPANPTNVTWAAGAVPASPMDFALQGVGIVACVVVIIVLVRLVWVRR